ncbi:hypothetical protein [Algoriphagus chordae]|uniref:Uncharacterized protein n=1 Tax=Algoriphagus chordae TaxID=237019 RepID=A0A2W7QY92_9BACT|nr:hypothetical protein [Algoriphagus chordae]PZX48657.1 hypothetical protein LV85_03471 [Algoriphagus chordae]
MRQLSEQELDQVKRAIAAKELTSAEILLEIYDHYVSHLESVESLKFEEELFELEQKFKYSHCHALQAKFLQASKKEIFNLQWSIFKTYFTWPRIVATAVFVAILIFVWNTIDSQTQIKAIVLVTIICILSSIGFYINSFRKARGFKKLIKSNKTIESSYASTIMVQGMLMQSLFHILFFVPNLGFANIIESEYFGPISLCIFFIYISLTLTLIRAWKIKSKTALI